MALYQNKKAPTPDGIKTPLSAKNVKTPHLFVGCFTAFNYLNKFSQTNMPCQGFCLKKIRNISAANNRQQNFEEENQ